MRLSVIDAERCTGCQICMFACTRRLGYAGMGKTAIHVKSVGGMEHGLSVVVCRACEDPPCAKVCPEDALVLRKGGGVLLNPSKCTGCGLCRQACIVSAIFWDKEAEKPIICVHCGYCAKYCPHGVLALEERREEVPDAAK